MGEQCPNEQFASTLPVLGIGRHRRRARSAWMSYNGGIATEKLRSQRCGLKTLWTGLRMNF